MLCPPPILVLLHPRFWLSFLVLPPDVLRVDADRIVERSYAMLQTLEPQAMGSMAFDLLAGRHAGAGALCGAGALRPVVK